MCSDGIVVTNVVGDDAAQMALADDYRVFQALSANRANNTLNVQIRPGRTERSSHLDQPKSRYSSAEPFPVNRVVVMLNDLGRVIYAYGL